MIAVYSLLLLLLLYVRSLIDAVTTSYLLWHSEFKRLGKWEVLMYVLTYKDWILSFKLFSFDSYWLFSCFSFNWYS